MSRPDPAHHDPAAARPAEPPRRAPAGSTRRDARGRGSRPHEQLEGQLVLPGCEDPELERCRSRHPAARATTRPARSESPAVLVGEKGPRRRVSTTPGVIRVVD